MLASGVWLPGMRSGLVWRHGRRTVRGHPQKPPLFDGHYLRYRSTLDIGVLGYIGIVQHKEHSPEVLSIPPGTPCIHNLLLSLRHRQRHSIYGVLYLFCLNGSIIYDLILAITK